MRRKPQWLALLLVLGLILAACGDGGGGDTTTTAAEEEEATTTAAPAEETTTSAAEEAAGDVATDVGVDLEAGTITVGLLSDLSGPFAPLVQVIVSGQEMYWADVNANGGIGGLEVVLADPRHRHTTRPHMSSSTKSSRRKWWHSVTPPVRHRRWRSTRSSRPTGSWPSRSPGIRAGRTRRSTPTSCLTACRTASRP